MLTWTRRAVLGPVKCVTQPQFEYLFDANANSIGALLLHLAGDGPATDRRDQVNTFEGVDIMKNFPGSSKVTWGAAMMDLGDAPAARAEADGSAGALTGGVSGSMTAPGC